MGNSISLHNKRKLRNRKALKAKSYGKLRLSVFRSSRHIYGQIIVDIQGITITSASSLESNIKKQFKNCGTKEVASLVGKKIAEKAIKKGVKNVVFENSRLTWANAWATYKNANFKSGFKNMAHANEEFLKWRANIEENLHGTGFNNRFIIF